MFFTVLLTYHPTEIYEQFLTFSKNVYSVETGRVSILTLGMEEKLTKIKNWERMCLEISFRFFLPKLLKFLKKTIIY